MTSKQSSGPQRMAELDPTTLYTVEEMAPLLRVNRRTIRKFCAEKVLKNAFKIKGSRRWLIPGADVLALDPSSDPL
jgi:excisionase family DNA binding protein